MHVHTGTKRCVIDEDSSNLWHQRLGHISIDRINGDLEEEIYMKQPEGFPSSDGEHLV